MIRIYLNPDHVRDQLGAMTLWCTDLLGLPTYCFSVSQYKPINRWGYTYLNGHWYFEFHQPEQATLFALRWGQYIVRQMEIAV